MLISASAALHAGVGLLLIVATALTETFCALLGNLNSRMPNRIRYHIGKEDSWTC